MNLPVDARDSVASGSESRLRGGGRGSYGLLVFFGVFVAFFALAVALQALSGAYSAELTVFQDEPAHFTTGLMVRDYLANGIGTAPMAYAENYYLHYPKVALGHWPPMFYLLEGVWLLIFPVARASVLALVAVYTALCATLIARWIAPRFSLLAGCLTGAFFILIPLVQEQTRTVMSGILMAIFCFLAVVEFAKFLETGSWRPAALFGLLASCAILTKGNAWALVLVPPLAIFFTRRFRLLATWQLWISAGIVVVLCLPWQWLTLHMAAQGWNSSTPNLPFTLNAVQDFTLTLWNDLNPVVCLVLLAGICASVILPWIRRERVDCGMASMLSLMVAVFVFNSVVPAGPDPRKMIDGFPGLLAFLPAGVFAVAGWLKDRRFRWLSRPAVVALITGLFFAGETFAIERKDSFGFEQAAAWLTRQPGLAKAAVLVSSNWDGEGLMISETELRENPRPGHYVLRAGRVLAQADWDLANYKTRYKTVAEVRTALETIPVGVLVIDFRPGQGSLPRLAHHDQLLSMIVMHPDEWKLAGSFHADGSDVSPVRIYERTGDMTIRGRIRIDMTGMLNRFLEK